MISALPILIFYPEKAYCGSILSSISRNNTVGIYLDYGKNVTFRLIAFMEIWYHVSCPKKTVISF